MAELSRGSGESPVAQFARRTVVPAIAHATWLRTVLRVCVMVAAYSHLPAAVDCLFGHPRVWDNANGAFVDWNTPVT